MVASSAMKIWLGRLLLGVLGVLPLHAVRAIAIVLASPLRLLARRKQVIAGENIARAFPELDPGRRSAMVRANVQELVSTVLECGPLWRRSPEWIRARIRRVQGGCHLASARAEGRGVLLLGGHLGNWELTLLYGALSGPVDFLYKPPKSDELDRLLSARRARFGARMVPTGGAAMRRVLRTLRGGGAVGLLFDQLPKGGDFVVAPFFGRPAATMTLPHRLIRATGCAVVMGHCLRTPDGTGWRIRIELVPGADDPDPVAAATAMNRALESAVREAPEQYLWHYRRFEPLAPRVD